MHALGLIPLLLWANDCVMTGNHRERGDSVPSGVLNRLTQCAAVQSALRRSNQYLFLAWQISREILGDAFIADCDVTRCVLDESGLAQALRIALGGIQCGLTVIRSKGCD